MLDGKRMTSIYGLSSIPRVIAAADVDDVMREQLEFLIEHAHAGRCGCSLCQHYQKVRSLLMELFSDELFEPEKAKRTAKATA
jgi:hypothetical protein